MNWFDYNNNRYVECVKGTITPLGWKMSAQGHAMSLMIEEEAFTGQAAASPKTTLYACTAK